MQDLVDTADVASYLPRPDRNPLPKPGVSASMSPFKVRFHDLDFNLHLNNTYYIQWMLDSLPVDRLAHGQLQDLDIQYLYEARHGERVISLTEKVDTHTYLHQLIREEDEKELARAKTVWHSGDL
jgi:acyl-ACP thioesterase